LTWRHYFIWQRTAKIKKQFRPRLVALPIPMMEVQISRSIFTMENMGTFELQVEYFFGGVVWWKNEFDREKREFDREKMSFFAVEK
jgi:hypothetical protein